MKIKLQRTRAGFTALLLLLIGSVTLWADELFLIPAASVARFSPGARELITAQANQHAGNLYEHLMLKLDEIERVCGLADRQRAKLKVAAKGAVERAVTRWLETDGPLLAIPEIQQQVQQAQERAVRMEQLLNQIQTKRQEQELEERQLQLSRRAIMRRMEALGDDADDTPAHAELRAQLARVEAEQGRLKQQQKVLEDEAQTFKQQLAAAQPAAAAAPAQVAPAPVAPQPVQVPAGPWRIPQGALLGGRGIEIVDGGILDVEDVRINFQGGAKPRTTISPVLKAAAGEKEKVWIAAIDGTLTAEQKERLAAADAERAACQPNTAAERLVAEIDKTLLLDPKQRRQLIHLADKVIDSYGKNAASLRNPELRPSSLLAAVQIRLSGDELASMLSPTQMARWQKLTGRGTRKQSGLVPADSILNTAPVILEGGENRRIRVRATR